MSGPQRRPPAGIEEQLRLDESEVLHAYADHLGYWTIGVGRLIDRRKGGGISIAESAYLLGNDLARIEAALDQRLAWWRELDGPRRGVLLNMAFQMGLDGLLGFSTTLTLVRTRQYEEAARQMLRSKWASQTPERAHRIADQMRAGAWR